MIVCVLCGRSVELESHHHLIPRTRHALCRKRRSHTVAQLNRQVDICQPCHSKVHSVLTEKELERTYNTVETLAEHPEIKAFVEWIKDKQMEFLPSKLKR